MTVKINYLNKTNSNYKSNLVLFIDDKFNINGLKKILSNSELSYISDLLKKSDTKKNLFVFEINSNKKIVLISLKKDLKISDIENLGAEFYKLINHGKNSEYNLISESFVGKNQNFIGHFLHGLKLKSN